MLTSDLKMAAVSIRAILDCRSAGCMSTNTENGGGGRLASNSICGVSLYPERTAHVEGVPSDCRHSNMGLFNVESSFVYLQFLV